ncbi:amidoligase family protein [Roseiterribacter gracilis]|uniref:Amidoligase enzyme n=1 Tax=Roseiterribacter gracilis TaxID=2812848 RepID=A0A8S8XBK3_9PROT|nr:hypothetical protein TMPK1_12360 [Rhodospirillales bacterium TMPK1]
MLSPPRPLNAQGLPRRVGVELEFGELDPLPAAQLIADRFGGQQVELGAHRFAVRDSRLGNFTIELDISSAHAEQRANADMLDELIDEMRVAWGHVGKLWMPHEIAAPPVAFDALPEIDALIADLRNAGAVGTEGGLLYAFGLHFNPEVASFEIAHLLSVLRAYLLAAPWLREQGDIDTVRRLSPFIDPFPDDYIAYVIDATYTPGLERFVADYLTWNPTRNRELDLFPLFAHVAPALFASRIDDKQTKPRPTWHWRLPNSRVGVPGWSILPDWSRWVVVERLAEDAARIEALAQLWRKARARDDFDSYLQASRAWIEPLGH